MEQQQEQQSCIDCGRSTVRLDYGTQEARLCQSCYRKRKRRERGLQKPGPAPQPEKFRSRHNPDNPTRAKPNRSGRKFATETHCANGHPWTEETIYEYPLASGEVRRQCRLCVRAQQQRYKGRPVTPDTTPIGPRNRDKTHCPHGHEYTPENIFRQANGSRQCKICAKYSRIKQTYGLSREEFDALWERTDGRCEICGAGDERQMDIDHHHDSGAVRGILCTFCNRGLGMFQDDIALLCKALAYLQKR